MGGGGLALQNAARTAADLFSYLVSLADERKRGSFPLLRLMR